MPLLGYCSLSSLVSIIFLRGVISDSDRHSVICRYLTIYRGGFKYSIFNLIDLLFVFLIFSWYTANKALKQVSPKLCSLLVSKKNSKVRVLTSSSCFLLMISK